MKPVLNVQYGCGLSAPDGWLNFDASPSLRIRKIPVIGKHISQVPFPDAVHYGDIVKGLPGIGQNTCDALYCCHVLEHLSFEDCKTALKNSYSILKPGGLFRCVLPDLQAYIEQYMENKKTAPVTASSEFMRVSMLGMESRPTGFIDKLRSLYGNSHHLWMWDNDALQQELLNAGFSVVRKCSYGDSENPDFKLVEEPDRFWAAISLEAIK